MPREAKPARLFRYSHTPVWYIRDGSIRRSTGFTSREQAETALQSYIAQKNAPRVSAPDEITVAKILTIYAEEKAIEHASRQTTGYCLKSLIPFFGPLLLRDVRKEVCQRYARQRINPRTGRPVSADTIRRELGVLIAAISYCKKNGYITEGHAIEMPRASEPRDRWITRGEAARLIWAAYRGNKSKHLAHFIIIALYTGMRKSSILKMQFSRNDIGGNFDVSNKVMYKRGLKEVQTKKHRNPTRIPQRLLSHLSRWERRNARFAVEFEGAGVLDLKRSFATACASAQIKDLTIHDLKHTAITWAMQNGATTWDAAKYFSTSIDMIERVYGHHSPSAQSSAILAIDKRNG